MVLQTSSFNTARPNTVQHAVIVDGDGGGDELQLLGVLLASDKVKVIAGTSCFGNVGQHQVFQNMRDITHFLNQDKIPIYPGASCDSDGTPTEEDGAHGSNGLGGVTLPHSHAPKRTKDAVDYILQTLKNRPAQSVSITASGPLTNIAKAINQDPETMARVKDIIIMGGCLKDMKAVDMPTRRGNITKNAEFNFFNAPQDAKKVLQSGLPITLLPMDCTHQLTFGPEQKAIIQAAKIPENKKKPLLTLLGASEAMDLRKFNIPGVMHDVHCALYLLDPSQYETRTSAVNVNTDDNQNIRGRTDYTDDSSIPKITVGENVKDPARLFNTVKESFETIFKA
ncbi:MAG TPA: hypothetical protein DHW71_14555 [Gammaproteobacteria bacterium]|nr:hypothetical protein [Gammaproteobacteria bacterium]HBF08124.1 hypothetical protein [Gammaproteobacteria bacterium]HCK94215.1 hypothetical protein [Gammaproteobacteria bacterium]|tara:strand:- start:170 stop:1186 length:1017 start_codon:yes stop_codon:yes gene_type:complete